MGVGYNMRGQGNGLNITLPDFSDEDAVKSYFDSLADLGDHHGVKRLTSSSRLYMEHMRKAEARLRVVKAALLVVNGFRTPLQSQKDKERALRTTALKFYASLSQPSLEKQATLLQVRYKHYTSREGLIDALVRAHITYFTYSQEEE